VWQRGERRVPQQTKATGDVRRSPPECRRDGNPPAERRERPAPHSGADRDDHKDQGNATTIRTRNRDDHKDQGNRDDHRTVGIGADRHRDRAVGRSLHFPVRFGYAPASSDVRVPPGCLPNAPEQTASAVPPFPGSTARRAT